MEEDNLQETSNPIEIYNNVDIEPPVIKEEVLADTIPKVEVPEKAELRELPTESEITGGLELTYIFTFVVKSIIGFWIVDHWLFLIVKSLL